MRIFCPAIRCSRSFLCDAAGVPETERCRGTAAGGLIAKRPPPYPVLLEDLGDATRADRPATLTDGEPQALFHGDGLDERDLHVGVVTRHDHLSALRQVHDAGD